MRKKILLRCGIGFLVGVVMVLLIPALFNRTADGTVLFYSDRLLARLGSPAATMLFTLVLYGLYGAACMGGTLLYEIEGWSLAYATVVHYLVIALGYVVAATLLCWDLSLKLLLLIEFMMGVGFLLIWLGLYLRYKAQVRELNELLQKRKEAGKDR